jgi:hypothetical protein
LQAALNSWGATTTRAEAPTGAVAAAAMALVAQKAKARR